MSERPIEPGAELVTDGAVSADGADEETISVGITEDNRVWLQLYDLEIEMSPEEARELAQALRETADDADSPTE